MGRCKEWNRKKKGVAGIIAATILFAMIFTTGAAYFLFVQYNYQLQHVVAKDRQQMEFEQSREQFLVGGFENTFYAKLFARVNNTGPVAINVIQIFYVNADSGTYIKEENFTTPITVNPGELVDFGPPITKNPNSGISYFDGNRLIKVLTDRGNVKSGIYPPPEFPYISEGDLAQGLGLLRLKFLSFRYFTYDSNPNRLLNYPAGKNGFSVSASDSKNEIAFAVELRNVDKVDPLILKSSTKLWQFLTVPRDVQDWYIVNVNDQGVITSTAKGSFVDIILPPSQTSTDTVLIVFASTTDISQGSFSKVKVTWPSNVGAAVFLLVHGSFQGLAYGQNLPYSSVYWY